MSLMKSRCGVRRTLSIHGVSVGILPFLLACSGNVTDNKPPDKPKQAKPPLIEKAPPPTPKEWKTRWIAPGKSSGAPANPSDVMITDMDDDGYPDILVTRGAPHNLGTVDVLYGPHMSAKRSQTWSSDTPASYSHIRVGDLNDDGCLDMAVARLYQNKEDIKSSGGIDVFIAKKKGADPAIQSCARAFERIEAVKESDGYGVIDLALADIDRDGRLDIAATRGKEGRSELYGIPAAPRVYKNHMGVPKPDAPFVKWWSAPIGLVAAFSIVVDDFIGDDRPDILVGNRGWSEAVDRGDAKINPAWGVIFELPDRNASASAPQTIVKLDQYPTPDPGDAADGGEDATGQSETACPFLDFPNVFDIEVIREIESPPAVEISVGFSAHQCRRKTRTCPHCEDTARTGIYRIGSDGKATLESSFGESGHWGSQDMLGDGNPDERTLFASRLDPGLYTDNDGKIFEVGITFAGNKCRVDRKEIYRGGVAPLGVAVDDMDGEVTWGKTRFAGSDECRHDFRLPVPLRRRPKISMEPASAEHHVSYSIDRSVVSVTPCLSANQALTVKYPLIEDADVVFVQAKPGQDIGLCHLTGDATSSPSPEVTP